MGNCDQIGIRVEWEWDWHGIDRIGNKWGRLGRELGISMAIGWELGSVWR